MSGGLESVWAPNFSGKRYPRDKNFSAISLAYKLRSAYTKKWGAKSGGPWTKYKHNANLGDLYCSYKNLHQANTVVSQYLNTYRTFTSNTDWNMTHNQSSSHM